MGAARRRWGQHWLASDTLARDLVTRIDPRAGDEFLEIGAGRGRLTRALLEHPVRIVAVEVDPACCAILQGMGEASTVHADARLDVVQADVLQADDSLPWERAPFRAVGNLPYNVSSPILRWTVAHRRRLSDAHYMLQLEVANRLAAAPGTKEYGYLSVLVQAHFTAALLLRLSAGAFRPPPRVESGFVRLHPRPQRPGTAEPEAWLPVAEAAFAHRRKTLANALGLAGWERRRVERACAAAGIDPGVRAERLTAEEFALLAAELPGREE